MTWYKVKTRNHGFQKRLWEVGQVVEVPDDQPQPPHHFEKIGTPSAPEVKQPEVHTLAELGKQPEVKGGMASSLPKLDESPFKKRKQLKRK